MSSLLDKVLLMTPKKSAMLRADMVGFSSRRVSSSESSITAVGCDMLIVEGFYSYVHSGYEASGEATFYLGLLDDGTRINMEEYLMDINNPTAKELEILSMMYQNFEDTMDTLSAFYESLLHATTSVHTMIKDGMVASSETLRIEYEKEIQKRFV